MDTAIIEKKFKPIKPLIGVGLILFGLFLLSTLFQDVIRIKAVLGGIVAIPLGIILLLKPFDVACARCKKFLTEFETHLAEEDGGSMVAALKAKDISQVASIVNAGDLPPAAEVGDTRLVLEFEYCEECKSTARIRLTSTTYGTDHSNTKVKELVGWQAFSDDSIAAMIEEGGKRNEQQSAAKYRDLMPQSSA